MNESSHRTKTGFVQAQGPKRTSRKPELPTRPEPDETSVPVAAAQAAPPQQAMYKRFPRGHYTALAEIHAIMSPDVYLEIGVNTGASFTLAGASRLAIGVDPQPCLSYPQPVGTQLFTTTSDDFFASGALREVLGGRHLDLVFIDGMHWFECVLRDLINTERYCDPRSLVILHDILPPSEESAGRTMLPGPWVGDCWKAVPCLLETRPELRMSIVEVPPSGLCLITGLSGGNTALSERYDELIDRYMARGYWNFCAESARFAALTVGFEEALAMHLPWK